MRAAILPVLALGAAGCVSILNGRPQARQALPDGRDRLAPADARACVVRSAESFLGARYVYGGTGADGLDCSGLTQRVYSDCGRTLPRKTFDQFRQGRPRWRNELTPGDLVFFETEQDAGATHVGVYVGDGKFIHAPSSGKAVERSDLADPYWKQHFLAGRDILDSK